MGCSDPQGVSKALAIRFADLPGVSSGLVLAVAQPRPGQQRPSGGHDVPTGELPQQAAARQDAMEFTIVRAYGHTPLPRIPQEHPERMPPLLAGGC